MLNVFFLCLSLWMQSDPQTMQLSPSVRSLKQLAEELNAQGVAVQCEPSIANRIALVNVRPRSWDNLRPLLERGLEVRFTRLPQGTWKLAADPVAASREKTLRDRFVVRYSRGIRDALLPTWNAAEALRRMDKAQRDEKEADLHARLAQARAILRDPDRVREMIPQDKETIRQANSAGQAWDLFTHDEMRFSYVTLLQQLNLSALLQAPAVAVDHVASLSPDNPVLDGRKRVWLQANATYQQVPVVAMDWYDLTYFDPLTFRMWENINVAFEPLNRPVYESELRKRDTIDLVPGYVPHLDFTLRDVFRDAGQERALSANEQATQAWQGLPVAAQKVALAVSERTLSSFVQRWSAQSQQEVVMEVSAQRDVLPGYNVIEPALTLNMAYALQSGRPPQTANGHENDQVTFGGGYDYREITPAVEQTPLEINVPIWTAQQADGVTLIHNELAFLDNLATRNPNAALRLVQLRGQHADLLPTFDDLLVACRILSPRDNQQSYYSTLYRGLGNYAGAQPCLRLIDQYSKRDALLRDLAASGVAYLECEHCSLSAINTFVDSMRSLDMFHRRYIASDLRMADCLSRDFPTWARRCVIQIKTEPSEFGKGVWVRFTLYKAAELDGKQVLAYPLELWWATVGPVHDPKTSSGSKQAN